MNVTKVLEEANRYNEEKLYSLVLGMLQEHSKSFDSKTAQSAVAVLDDMLCGICNLSTDKQLYYKKIIESAELLRTYFMEVK